MTPRGGVREGAGAPKKDPDKKRISVTVKLDPELVEWLDGLDGKSRSRKIEVILRGHCQSFGVPPTSDRDAKGMASNERIPEVDR